MDFTPSSAPMNRRLLNLQWLEFLPSKKVRSPQVQMKVTFDSNVWETLVSQPSGYPVITEMILSGAISPYLCEISICLESIQRAERQDFFRNYFPTINITPTRLANGTIDLRVEVRPNTAAHPGLSPILLKKLHMARELGFKVIRMTNFGTVRSSEIPEDMLLKAEDIGRFWPYADRLADCREFIKSLGCGSHDYESIKQSRQPASPKDLERSVAEWADGEAISAHYAFNADVFCTNDRGRNAGASSVFHPSKLENKRAVPHCRAFAG
jgi:hypothetical protein